MPAAPTDLTAGETRRLMQAAGQPLGSPVESELADIAPVYAMEEAVSRRLFFLCVKRDLLDLILGDYWSSFATQYGDEKEQQDQMFTHLRTLRSDCDADIETLREQIAAGAIMGSGYVYGDMVNKTPIDGCCDPNPSDRSYGGDPLRRTVGLGGDLLRP